MLRYSFRASLNVFIRGRIDSIALKSGDKPPVIIGVEPSGKLKRQVASASEWEGRIADMQDILNRVGFVKGV